MDQQGVIRPGTLLAGVFQARDEDPTRGLHPALSGRENAGEGSDRLSGGLKFECMETLVSVILIAPLAFEGQMREHLAHFVEYGKRGCR